MNTVTDPRRRSIALASMLVAGGFVALGIAWSGVTGTLSVPEQVPFAVSGAIGGGALIGTGLALVDIQRRRYEAAEERRDLAAFAAELSELAELMAASPPARPRRRVLRGR